MRKVLLASATMPTPSFSIMPMDVTLITSHPSDPEEEVPAWPYEDDDDKPCVLGNGQTISFRELCRLKHEHRCFMNPGMFDNDELDLTVESGCTLTVDTLAWTFLASKNHAKWVDQSLPTRADFVRYDIHVTEGNNFYLDHTFAVWHGRLIQSFIGRITYMSEPLTEAQTQVLSKNGLTVDDYLVICPFMKCSLTATPNQRFTLTAKILEI